jgi:tetratricopeptide (TPR) repeat protein
MLNKKVRWILIPFCWVFVFSVFAQLPLKPNERQLQQRLASEYERLGDFEQALRIYTKLYQQDSNDNVVADAIQRVLIEQKRYDEAIKFINQRLLQRYDLRVHSELGNVLYKMGDEKAASDTWNVIIQKNEGNPNVYQFVARMMIQNRLLDEAIQVFQQGRKKLHDDDLFTLDLAGLYAARLDYRKATKEYLRYLSQNPSQYAYIELNLNRFTSEEPEALADVIQVLKEFLGRAPEQLNYRKLLVSTYLSVAAFDQAFAEIIELDAREAVTKKKNEGGEMLFEFANYALQDGNYSFAEQSFKLLLQRYPQSVYAERARFGLARSLQLQENHGGALEIYQQLLTQDQNSYQAAEALLQIGDVKLNSQFDPASAREAYLKLLKDYRSSENYTKATFRVGDCYFAEGNLKEARKWYEKPLKEKGVAAPVKIQASFNLAQLDLAEDHFEDAQTRFNEIVSQVDVKNDFEGQTLVNDALEWSVLIEENRVSTDSSFHLFTKTIQLKRAHKYDQAVAKLTTIILRFPTAVIVDEALAKKAEFYTLLGNYLNAVKTYQQLIQDFPESYLGDQAKFKMGGIYETNLMDYHQAIQTYEQFLVEYPKSIYLEEVRRRIRILERNL